VERRDFGLARGGEERVGERRAGGFVGGGKRAPVAGVNGTAQRSFG
jgi:hypothetical protein